MKHLILAATLFATPAMAGTEAVKAELACTWATIQAAASGDFSQWVLPDFVPGKHLKAGEYAACMPEPVNPWRK